MREKIVNELVKEVLGPRTNDIRETMPLSPVTEFISGVLAPTGLHDMPTIDDDSEIPAEDTQTYEGETSESDVDSLPIFQPALDPKSKPSTMGLSFVAEFEEEPKIDVCLTWARYKGVTDKTGRISQWKREPKFFLQAIQPFKTSVLFIDTLGRVGTKNGAEISLHVMANSLGGNRCLIHLYIVNELPNPQVGFEATSEDCIFQPQIRVCKGNTRIAQGVRKKPAGREERVLEFLYRHRPILARGHLCSAIWKRIDPQIAGNYKLTFPECASEIPFFWIDGSLLTEYGLSEEKKRFSECDVRTEFVPLYAIANPDLEWPKDLKPSPELNATMLSEAWSANEIKAALSPISLGLKLWVSQLEKQVNDYSVDEQALSADLISESKMAQNRIEEGISLLCNNEEARLAFCFANKAISIQASWGKRKEFVWRPFQLAFILMTIESIFNPKSKYRTTCDVLWVPTGTGKTEAYLALIAFVTAYRRRNALTNSNQELTGAGVSVITRYTLRLLTIQQFRRTLSLITACEFLRVYNLGAKSSVGWRPINSTKRGDFIWGSTPFSCGLWVGGNVSPNKLSDLYLRQTNQYFSGAISILKGGKGEGEPAQILSCPACGAILAVPEMGLSTGSHQIHLVVKHNSGDIRLIIQPLSDKIFGNVKIVGQPRVFALEAPSYFTLTLNLDVTGTFSPKDLDAFWENIISTIKNIGVQLELAPIKASRNGYFEKKYEGAQKGYDFEVFCPSPSCDLNHIWVGGLPAGSIADNSTRDFAPNPDGHTIPCFPDGNRLVDIQMPFRKAGSVHISNRIPIPALTVEDQVFRKLPSVVVATVDKFARPPFNPQAAGLFGNVDAHNSIHGYFRNTTKLSSPLAKTQKLVHSLAPPNLIVQDELHLIEGPLGSLVGLYETAIDFLGSEKTGNFIKYIASTATIRRAEDQTRAIFLRELQLFPTRGLDGAKRFFITEREVHALDDSSAGRLYLGICSPGRGPLTPLVRIYSRLLFTVGKLTSCTSIDDFWTLTGYFNAIRELGGARALYRQDIPQRIHTIADIEHESPRNLDDSNVIELSSRGNSIDLPAILRILEQSCYPNAPDALFTTSMFGTGIDVSRIGLMVVNGQPKTTSSYIQSTGRVGRKNAALVVTFLRASRPRDLNHYEFFEGYHSQLHRYVEPTTVYPFSPGALERALGPVMVFILRNMRTCVIQWSEWSSAHKMAGALTSCPEVKRLPHMFETRAQGQPVHRRPMPNSVEKLAQSRLALWQSIAVLADSERTNLRYNEYNQAENPVVLGDYRHLHSTKDVVYKNAPQSLRDIEETTSFQTRG